ncbi:MAG: glycoside hydrolase family 3 C-terminal domain-containing protein [Clostridiales bacterium]|nr:glycoside hydrolase family 3 C-terminal domain-containing protein [Clostridiales bacterium]
MERWARAKYQPCLPLGQNKTRITECDAHLELSRRAAWEGTVLLKNNSSLLPLKKGTKLAVFGKAQFDYVKGGGGSGDVFTSHVTNIYEGLKTKSGVDVFEELSAFYDAYVKNELKKGEDVWPGMFAEPELDEKLVKAAAEFTDTAIITINRYSGEGWDRKNSEDDDYFYLSKTEKAMVDTVLANFKHVIVMLNTGAMIDASWFADNDKIEAALLIWQGGSLGGLAAADILVGDAVPSGKLVDTCAASFDDYPSSEGFAESEDYVKYSDDVFVGYRYFQTVPGADKKVVYPFGYGLSYTSFDISNISLCSNGKVVFVTAAVKNTGAYKGKEIVEVYFEAPAGVISKPKRQLCAFAKTPMLAPGEECRVTASFEIEAMASYDDLGQIQKSAYVMEKGEYKFYVGKSVRDVAEAEFKLTLDDNVITKQLSEYCPPKTLEKRMLSDGSYIPAKNSEREPLSFECTYTMADKPEEKYMLEDVECGKITLDEFIAQLSNEQLVHIVSGQPNLGVANTMGMGDVEEFGIPRVMTADGPAGLRLERKCGTSTTAFPVASMLACTWNEALVEEVGKAGALEVKENNLAVWLTPALNIHRSPLCGRNFEYFSEDPLIAGKMAAAKVRGIQSENICACPKHFACNNKETNRTDSDSVVSERALREIYIKGFEICVKESNPGMIMTSYNIVNGVRSSENAELLTGILRGEWGYKGMVTTDWWNHADHVKEIAAGNDVRMPVSDEKAVLERLENGEITREQTAQCAKRILEMILKID